MSELPNPLNLGKKPVEKGRILASGWLPSGPKLGQMPHDYARRNSICLLLKDYRSGTVCLFFNNLGAETMGTKNADKMDGSFG